MAITMKEFDAINREVFSYSRISKQMYEFKLTGQCCSISVSCKPGWRQAIEWLEQHDKTMGDLLDEVWA